MHDGWMPMRGPPPQSITINQIRFAITCYYLPLEKSERAVDSAIDTVVHESGLINVQVSEHSNLLL